MANPLIVPDIPPRHFLSVEDLSLVEQESITDRAQILRLQFKNRQRLKTLVSKRVVLIFQEWENTGPYLDYEVAIGRLGGKIPGTNGESSMDKRESAADSVRTAQASTWSDLVIVRQTQTDAHTAASTSVVPVISAGDRDNGDPLVELFDANIEKLRDHWGRLALRAALVEHLIIGEQKPA